ncbi:hypothetical protein LINGRAHAP2_LOCUS30600 [Linum grandiflorum]
MPPFSSSPSIVLVSSLSVVGEPRHRLNLLIPTTDGGFPGLVYPLHREANPSSPLNKLRLLLWTCHRTKITIYVLHPPPPIRAYPRRCSSSQLLHTTVTVDTRG